MLTHLRIRNLALVAELEWELQPGLNVITGETGAGKSIVIGALDLLLGGRADRTLLRAGAEACTVEAVLELPGAPRSWVEMMAERGVEAPEDGQWLLKRTFTAAGANRQFINGSPTSLQTLAALGEWLVDIHGPHDHQSLFQVSRQLELVDAHAGLRGKREALAAVFDQRAAIRGERESLVGDDAALARRLDLLRHQVREITEARFTPEEEVSLEREHARASHAVRLREWAAEALGRLADEDDAVSIRVGQVGRLLQDMGRLDAGAAELVVLQERLMEDVRELQAALGHYVDTVDVDPGRLAELEERVNLLQTLRRKYGGTVEAILAFGEEAAVELARWESRESELERLASEEARLDGALRNQATALTTARRAALPKLAKAVTTQLRDLGFRQAQFNVAWRAAVECLRTGADVVEFEFAPNPGEPSRPLRAIASSGEMARVMLALKTVLAAEDDVPVLVFDEVDANIGGETAHAVGAKMRAIGRQRQVLCITHLAQVAACGSSHFVVNKVTRGGRTLSEVTPVDGASRVDELARMLGGGTAARAHAAALLDGVS
jgi:DNA repair protein RecN (Recombination protein N)